MNAEKFNLHEDSKSGEEALDLSDLYEKAKSDEDALKLSKDILAHEAFKARAERLITVASYKKDLGEVTESNRLLEEAGRLGILGNLIESRLKNSYISNFNNSQTNQSPNQNSPR